MMRLAHRRTWKGREGKGREGKGREGKGREGKGREGKGREGKGRGKGREGKGREGKGREGKGREGKGREGKGREVCFSYLSIIILGYYDIWEKSTLIKSTVYCDMRPDKWEAWTLVMSYTKENAGDVKPFYVDAPRDENNADSGDYR